MFEEDIENILGLVYHHVYPFIRRSEKRIIRVQISNDFFLHLRSNLNVTGRFKDANTLIEAYSIPTVREIDRNGDISSQDKERLMADFIVSHGSPFVSSD